MRARVSPADSCEESWRVLMAGLQLSTASLVGLFGDVKTSGLRVKVDRSEGGVAVVHCVSGCLPVKTGDPRWKVEGVKNSVLRLRVDGLAALSPVAGVLFLVVEGDVGDVGDARG